MTLAHSCLFPNLPFPLPSPAPFALIPRPGPGTLHGCFADVGLHVALVDGGRGARGRLGQDLFLEARPAALALRQAAKGDDGRLEVGQRALHERALALVVAQQVAPQRMLPVRRKVARNGEP